MPNINYVAQGLDGEQIEAALTAIDGVVTQENNGKVLAIEAGKIVAKNASEWTDTPVLEPLSITANGDYTPGEGVDGYNSVHVAVPGGGGGTIEPLNVTHNGTYSPPSNVDGFAPVTVNVSGGGSGAVLSGTDAPTSEQGENGDVFLQYTISDSGIISDGAVKIDTGVPVSGVYGAEIMFKPISAKVGYPVHLSSNSDNFTIGSSGFSGLFIRVRGQEMFNSSNVLSTDNVNTVILKDGQCSLNGSQISTFDSTVPLGTDSSNVFCFSPADGSRASNILLVSVKLYDQNGALIFNGEPAQSSGTACLHDTVSETNKLGAGTGMLTYQKQGYNVVAAYLKESDVWGDWYP